MTLLSKIEKNLLPDQILEHWSFYYSQHSLSQDQTNLLPDQILELLEFLLLTTFLIFNGEFHQQTDGVAMGGPASSIIAEIYMISIETTAITTADTPPRENMGTPC